MSIPTATDTSQHFKLAVGLGLEEGRKGVDRMVDKVCQVILTVIEWMCVDKMWVTRICASEDVLIGCIDSVS